MYYTIIDCNGGRCREQTQGPDETFIRQCPSIAFFKSKFCLTKPGQPYFKVHVLVTIIIIIIGAFHRTRGMLTRVAFGRLRCACERDWRTGSRHTAGYTWLNTWLPARSVLCVLDCSDGAACNTAEQRFPRLSLPTRDAPHRPRRRGILPHFFFFFFSGFYGFSTLRTTTAA